MRLDLSGLALPRPGLVQAVRNGELVLVHLVKLLHLDFGFGHDDSPFCWVVAC